MTETVHPAASHHLPSFITQPGQTDVLMVVTSIILLLAVVGFGILFFRIHSLPERIAHKTHKLQFEIVAVLCLLALFTHIHLFWVAALLLALVEFPDFGGFMSRVAGSVEKIAETKPGQATAEVAVETTAGSARAGGSGVSRDASAAKVPHEAAASVSAGNAPATVVAIPERHAPASTRS
jgi:multisubunit Na+/H+ antiporter MnhF subunit